MLTQKKQINDINITFWDYKKLKELILEKSGLYFNQTKRMRLENRVKRRMVETCIYNPREYYEKLCNDNNELLHLFSEITVNESRFFRNPDHFSVLKEIIENLSEDLLTTHDRKKLNQYTRMNNLNIRIWSAACATGEEPYSIAMVLDDIKSRFIVQGKDIEKIQFDIITSDISRRAINIAKKGKYVFQKIKELPPFMQKRYFIRDNKYYCVNDNIKRYIKYYNINLKTDRYPIGLDIIMLRNVIMYFTIDERQKIIKKVYDALKPGGYLFLGDAETLPNKNKYFQMVKSKNALYFKKI